MATAAPKFGSEFTATLIQSLVPPISVGTFTLAPQAYNLPAVLIPNVIFEPAAIAVHVSAPICVGIDFVTVVLSPNCPVLFRPHVNSKPSARMAAV